MVQDQDYISNIYPPVPLIVVHISMLSRVRLIFVVIIIFSYFSWVKKEIINTIPFHFYNIKKKFLDSIINKTERTWLTFAWYYRQDVRQLINQIRSLVKALPVLILKREERNKDILIAPSLASSVMCWASCRQNN